MKAPHKEYINVIICNKEPVLQICQNHFVHDQYKNTALVSGSMPYIATKEMMGVAA